MEEGKILYGKDENYLLLNLKTMSPGFLNAHLLELSVFKDIIDGEKLDVLPIYKYSDVISGSSKLGIFDKQILVKLPKIEKDTYFIRVANDGMQGAAPGARLKFTAKGDLIEDEPQAPLQKEALTKEIAEAKKVEQGKKTDEAFSKLQAAITAAEETLKNATDQEALNQAATTLKAAVKTFNESADKVEPQPGPTPQPQPQPEPKPSYPSYPIYPWYNQSNKVSTSKANKNTEIKKQEVKEEPKKQEVKKENLNKERFTDINGHWAKEAIDYVVEKGYFAGVSATEFAPNRAITRGQLVTVLGRILNIDKTSFKSNNFKDVKADAYYAPYIAWAESVGITKGRGGGNFAPDKEITREEMAVMMVKFLKVSGKKLNAKGTASAFKDDGNIESWAKDAVVEMAKLGLVKGMEDGSFSPKTQFTRAQVAQILYNIDKN